jgi:hypothetical protein
MDEPAGTGRWLATLGRHPWYLAIMAVAAFGLVAGSVTVLVQANSTPSHQPTASNCGLVNCNAALPGPSSTISTQSQIGKAHTTVSHAPKPSASPTPSPAQAPINGRGRTTSPTGCTFNGAACPTLRVQQQPPQQQQPQFQQPQHQTAPDQPSSQSAQSSSPQTSQAAPSSPQSAPSSPQDQQPSPQDQQPSRDGQQGHHQRGQRSWQDDRQPSFWGWGFSSWH